MTELKVLTLLQAQEQVAARVAELYADMDAEVDEPDPDPEVQARDEVLERVCQSLAYMERSLAEVKEARDAEMNTLRAELDSLRGARREVARQMEAVDGAQGSAPKAPGAR